MPTRSPGANTPDYATRWTEPYWTDMLARSTAQQAGPRVQGQAYLRSPDALKQRPEYQFATTGKMPEGYHMGPDGFPITDPGIGDWLYKWGPTIIAAAGTAGIATTPALAGASLATKAGANAALQAGMKAGSGGSLKDVALAGASGAAGANTGGGMSWIDLLKDPNTYAAIATVAGQAAGGKSDQRMQQSQATNQSNLADLALYTSAQNAQNQAGQLDLNRKSFGEDARVGRAKQALLADLLSNIKDLNISVPGVQAANVTGGLRPSAIGESGRSSLAELSKQALAAQLKGDTFEGGKVLPTPQYQAMPQQGGLEKGLDWIGLLGGLAGALQKTQQPTTRSTLNTPNDVYRGLQ